MPADKAQLITLADAIVAAVKVQAADVLAYRHGIIVKRAYVPSLTLKELDRADAHIQVCPLSRTLSNLSRSQVLAEPVITLGVQARCSKDDCELLDELMLLVEQLAAFLQAEDTPSDGFTCEIVTNDPIFDAPTLHTQDMFFSLLKAKYQSLA